MNNKIIVGDSMKDTLQPIPAAIDSPRMVMVGKTVVNSDGSKDYVATCVSSEVVNAPRDPEIKGVVLKGAQLDIYGSADGFKEIPESKFAEDETYALPADAPRKPMLGDWITQGDKGVFVHVIPDDHMPTDVNGNKAELLVHPRSHYDDCNVIEQEMDLEVALPGTPMIGMDAAFDGDTLSGDPLVIVVAPNKPKQPTNHQRHGYSRRKAKRAYQARYKYMLKVNVVWQPLMSHLELLEIPTHSDVHMEQFMGRIRSKPEVGSFTTLTKPLPHGKGDING